MNKKPHVGRTAYFTATVFLVTMLIVLLAFNVYFRLKLGYGMILVGLAMLAVSLLTGAVGVVLSLRARARDESMRLWLLATGLGFTPAVVYIFLVARNIFQ